MRILLANKFYYRRAGAEAYLLDLEAALRAAGHEVAVFATKHPETLPTPWSRYFIPYRDFGAREGILKDAAKVGRMLWSSAASRAFRALIRDFRPDVLHAHNLYHHLSPSVIAAANALRVPVVQTLHDYKFVCPNYTLFTEHAACERCHVYRYWNAVVHRCVQGSRAASAAAAAEMWVHRALRVYERGVARFVTPSAFLRDLLIRWGKDGGRIVHVPNLVDLSRLPPASPEPGEGMLFVGRLEEWKGVAVALEAAAAAPDIPFRFVGGGALDATLRARASALRLANVAFLGALPRERTYEEMLRARAVVVPSIGYDPFPTVALEAGALGRAVVASRIGGIPEIVRDGETGLLVAPKDPAALVDAARRLHYDASFAVRLGRAAERHVRALVDPATHLGRILAVYGEAIRVRGAAATQEEGSRE